MTRVAALVPGFDPLRVEGDLFVISPRSLSVIDRLETGSAGLAGPYIREPVEVVRLDGADIRTAQAYVVRDRPRWRAVVERRRADALPTYPRELAAVERQKDCCVRNPGHPPPHDVIDPLEDIVSP